MVGENLAVAPTARLPDGTVAFGHGEVGAGYARAFGPQRRVRPGIVTEAGGCLAPVDAILLVADAEARCALAQHELDVFANITPMGATAKA